MLKHTMLVFILNRLEVKLVHSPALTYCLFTPTLSLLQGTGLGTAPLSVPVDVLVYLPLPFVRPGRKESALLRPVTTPLERNPFPRLYLLPVGPQKTLFRRVLTTLLLLPPAVRVTQFTLIPLQKPRSSVKVLMGDSAMVALTPPKVIGLCTMLVPKTLSLIRTLTANILALRSLSKTNLPPLPLRKNFYPVTKVLHRAPSRPCSLEYLPRLLCLSLDSLKHIPCTGKQLVVSLAPIPFLLMGMKLMVALAQWSDP